MTTQNQPKSIEDYISDRLCAQQKWFHENSRGNQYKYKCCRVIETVCILALPIVGIAPIAEPCRSAALLGLGAIATFIRFRADLESYHDLWLRYRLANETLKSEKYLYEMRTGVYESANPESILVLRTEEIIQNANGTWFETLKEEPSLPLR